MEQSIPQETVRAGLEKLDESMKLSSDEKTRLAKCFGDKEFMGMFAEYMQEIQDPKNRAEYEEYIRMVESGAADAPEGSTVFLPEAGLVVKTKGADGGKVFINVTHSDKVAAATSERQVTGESWKIPYSLDMPKDGSVDKAGKAVMVHDFCVNSASFRKFSADERLQKFMIDTAVDAVEAHPEVKGTAEVPLDTAHVVLKNKKYFGEGGKPHAQTIARDPDMPPQGADERMKLQTELANRLKQQEVAEAERRSDLEAPDTAPSAYAAAMASAPADRRSDLAAPPSGMKQGFLGAKKPGLIEEVEPTAAPATGVRVPKYSIIEHGRSATDLGDKLMGGRAGGTNGSGSIRPTGIVVRVELPGVASAGGIDLDVSEQRLVIGVEGSYQLDLALPYPVDEENGGAKFDRANCTMSVTLPVIPAPIPAPAPFVPTPDEEEEEQQEQEEADAAADGGKAAGGLSPSSPWVQLNRGESVMFMNQETGKSTLTRPPEGASGVEDVSEPAAAAGVGDGAFVAAKSFSGAKPGFSFKSGASGVGYYKDGGAAGAPPPAEAPPSEEAGTSSAAEAPAADSAAVPWSNVSVLSLD